ncbi:Arginine--tRNA ligase [Candidatus Sulfotelmatomonas gaucii]|uniref:arginine--tRNA ligase n=1 Tax=Candidatus Sulfuritelmatomonas gaucii TaxID=2043161 RepID=A0A2N9L256_9BACT|nr:Arginine--tRNA ligase [Candidatus Sulfotelmatomonas gaucii]
MVLELEKRLGRSLRAILKQKYDLEVANIPLETPPDLRLGEIATPIAFELARKLRKAPKIIAQEIVTALGEVEGFAHFEVAGAGYINARLDRAAAVRMMGWVQSGLPHAKGHALVEHTSINPNKAAHIGHLRNAILGDTFVRLLRAAGYKVDVQNYIDNTGVQVADVVVGFLHLERKSPVEIRTLIADSTKLAAGPEGYDAAIDYYCWDLYARTSQWYEQGTADEKAARKKLRLDTLHLIERGGNETAEIADLISIAVLRRHLETMLRLGIEYDFLPRESEILHLKFWDAAFEKLKKSGVLYFENEGKNKGCWVMTRPGAPTQPIQDDNGLKGTDDDAKVIVRSNGTVTYVGKDIAYHLWKFGLLGRDFGYKRFFQYPDHECWISAEAGEKEHPHFGDASAIYNVIDSRQSDPQANVVQALRGMGYAEQADHYTHFSYEMVALTPRCAIELGYEVVEEDRGRAYIEVSGRKGFGVKADDLIDKLIAATRAEVDARQTGGTGENADAERHKIARQIAIGALRYFMLKYTRNSVIAFDFKDALSFEGETGPYIQYAVVRIRNIFRKGGTSPEAALAELAELEPGRIAQFLSGEENDDIWALWLRAGRSSMVLEQCISGSEPAYLAKHAFQLAQEFANFYHRHHILTEEDPARKTLLLATAAITLRELVASLALLGIESPEAM